MISTLIFIAEAVFLVTATTHTHTHTHAHSHSATDHPHLRICDTAHWHLACCKLDYYYYEPQSRFARLWLDMIIAQSDAHNFDAALNNSGLQPVGPRSVEAFQRTDVDSTDYDRAAVCSAVSQRSHFAARRAAVVSARRHLERPRFMASSRSAVPVELSTHSPSRNSLTQIQRQRRSSRCPTPNCSVLVNKAMASV